MHRCFAPFGFLPVLTITVAAQLYAGQSAALLSYFEGAEQKFVEPSENWFYQSQQAVRDEAAKLSQMLDSQGPEYAAAWKDHLRWHLLQRNLGAIDSYNVQELRQVRRWLYSNREGLEGHYFAGLRQAMDEYLDAAETFAVPDLQATYNQKIALARQLSQQLAAEPNDRNAAALGRVLGWFETTRQLPVETAALQRMFSLPNAQVVVSQSLLQRVLASMTTDVEETVPLTGVETIPPSGLMRRPRQLQINGTATTRGSVSLELAPNDDVAEIQLHYRGEVESQCRAVTGPVTLHMRTYGTATAYKPIFFGLDGLTPDVATVKPKIKNTIDNISSNSAMLRRIAKRRANQPEAIAHKDMRARLKAIELLKDELDDRVEFALGEIKSEFQRGQQAMGKFSDVTAPLYREGAAPYFHSTSSTSQGIVLNGFSGRRHQFGASFPCPQTPAGDLQAQIHVSFINNLAETILGGKTITDTFFMRYAKILHAELPLPLMVHSRSRRWTVTMAKQRPLELVIPKPNHFQFIFRATGLELDGQQYQGEMTAKFTYAMADNGFDEIELVRVGDIELETSFDSDARMFLYEKIAAVFAPAFSGGGVVIPEGGMLGTLREIKSEGVQAANEWIVISAKIPDSVLNEVLRLRNLNAGEPLAAVAR